MILGTDFIQDPHALYAYLRANEPVREAHLPSGLKVWVVTRYADVRAVLSEPTMSKDLPAATELFERHTDDRPGGWKFRGDLSFHMLNSDPPTHTRLRKLVNRAFTGRTVANMRPRVTEITAGLIDALPVGEPVDLVERFAFPLPMAVICELLGVPFEDREKFRSWSTILVSNSTDEQITTASGEMAVYLGALAAAKAASGDDDLLTELVTASEEGDRLSPEEVVSMAFLLLVAGHETTVNLISTGVHALLAAPEQLARLRADRSLIPSAVEEFLRYDGPVNLATLRYTTEPVVLGDTEIPAGEFVLAALGSANRDPERFEDPDRLDVGRASGGHVGFGHGIHYCVGAPLARLEGEVALGALLDRFPGIELVGEAESLVYRDSVIMRGVTALPVRLST